jgi:hypothetical protein
MKRLLVLFLGITMACQAADGAFDTVEYRGQTIPLSRSYADFHEYRDDPKNLPPEVRHKVAQLVREAPVSTQYPTRKAVEDALFQLTFPGYGYSMLALGKPVALYSLEIPTAHEERFLTFAQKDGSWTLVDDFLWPDGKGYIAYAELMNGHLVYRQQGKGSS